jgi:hypothetical protein
MTGRGSGWILFAAIVLGVAGVMRIFDAIWAFRYHGALPENLEGAIFGHSLKTYGWFWLVMAAIYILCAVAVMGGSQVGRWLGVLAAGLGAVSAMWWIPYYPIWSLAYVAIGGLVMYALIVYGGHDADGEAVQASAVRSHAATG